MAVVACVVDVGHDLGSRQEQTLSPRFALELLGRADALRCGRLAVFRRGDLIFDGLALPSPGHDRVYRKVRPQPDISLRLRLETVSKPWRFSLLRNTCSPYLDTK